MNNKARFINYFILLLVAGFCLGACHSKKGAEKGSKHKNGVWVNPRRGKIFTKKNVIEIPLTAMELHIVGKVKWVRYKDFEVAKRGNDSRRVLVDSGYNVYNEAGYLINQNEYDSAGKLKYNCIYTYDDKNKAVEWNYTDNYYKKFSSKTTFRYDEKGNKAEEIWVGIDPKFSRKGVYKYDEKGKVTEMSTTSKDGKLNRLETYKYDSRGNETEISEWAGNGTLVVKRTARYDDKGNNVEGNYYISDTLHPAKEVMKYDNNGWCTQYDTYLRDGKLDSKTTIKYDEWGSYIEYLKYKSNGVLNDEWCWYTQYEYDKEGNVTKQTVYRMEKGKKVITGTREAAYAYYE